MGFWGSDIWLGTGQEYCDGCGQIKDVWAECEYCAQRRHIRPGLL